MTYQSSPPVSVYNGPDAPYQVHARLNSDGSVSQLVGLDPGNLDAFSRLRVSNPQPLLELMFRYDLQPLLTEAKVTTNGTVEHNAGLASAILTATSDNGSEAILQSRQYAPYSPGKSQLVALTFNLGAAVANVRRRVGYFDATDGIYLEQTSTGVTINLRSSVTDAVLRSVAQADWNLDPLDGSGPSGITIDWTVAQILLIDLQFLGVGMVRVAFDIDGEIVPVHAFQNANRITTQPYMISGSLPLRWEIKSTAASAGATMQAVCAQAMSEGGLPSGIGYSFAAANVADVATSTNRANVLAIRPKVEFPASSGIVPRGEILPGEISAIAASASVLIEVWYAPTFSGGNWTSADDNSMVEFSVNSTTSALGTRIDAFFVASGAGATRGAQIDTLASQYPLTVDIAGTGQRALLVTATAITGTGTVRSALSWREIR